MLMARDDAGGAAGWRSRRSGSGSAAAGATGCSSQRGHDAQEAWRRREWRSTSPRSGARERGRAPSPAGPAASRDLPGGRVARPDAADRRGEGGLGRLRLPAVCYGV